MPHEPTYTAQGTLDAGKCEGISLGVRHGVLQGRRLGRGGCFRTMDRRRDPPWQPDEECAGRFKRPRNAMIAVEDKARLILREHGDMVKIAIDA